MHRCAVKRLVPADGADEALGVVGPVQSRHHLPADEFTAAVAFRAVKPLVVLGADVLAGLLEESGTGQVTAAHCKEQHQGIFKVKTKGMSFCPFNTTLLLRLSIFQTFFRFSNKTSFIK